MMLWTDMNKRLFQKYRKFLHHPNMSIFHMVVFVFLYLFLRFFIFSHFHMLPLVCSFLFFILHFSFTHSYFSWHSLIIEGISTKSDNAITPYWLWRVTNVTDRRRSSLFACRLPLLCLQPNIFLPDNHGDNNSVKTEKKRIGNKTDDSRKMPWYNGIIFVDGRTSCWYIRWETVVYAVNQRLPLLSASFLLSAFYTSDTRL